MPVSDLAWSLAWYESRLGYRKFFEFVEEDCLMGLYLRHPRDGPDLGFIRVSERKTTKNRLHLDVWPTDRGQEEELARLLDLGAKRSSIIGSGSWMVLEDPEGNEFCLMSTQIPAEPAPFHDA